MTDPILLAIKGNASLQALADAGQDNALADALNANAKAAVPITVPSLMAAAPLTLKAIAAKANPLSEMEVIASRVRAGDYQGVGSWATTLHMLGTMSDAEYAAVEALVTAANPPVLVDHTQVTESLKAVRNVDPLIEGPQVYHNGNPVMILDDSGSEVQATGYISGGTVRSGAIDWSKV